MGKLTLPLSYRFLIALTPSRFWERHASAIRTQLARRRAIHLRHGGTRLGFWLRALYELGAAIPGLWLAAVRQRHASRFSPHDKDTPMSGLLQDVRYALRGLASRPLVTTLCALAIALGIGANTTVFTLANEIFLRPIPVREPSRLVDLHVDQPGANSFVGFSYPEFEQLRTSAGFEDISVHSGLRMRLGADGATTVSGQLNSANYLGVLGVDVARGRVFTADESRPGAPLVAVVSHGFWQRRLGGASDVLGTEIELDGHSATIIGVLAPGFDGRFIGFPSEIWLPLGALETFRPGAVLADRGNQMLESIGRLAPGASIEAATDAINVVAASLEERYPDTHRDRRVSLSRFTGLDESLRGGVVGFVGVLGVLSLLVLGAACLNVGNLLLARAGARRPEIATRLALGAPRTRVVRQLLTETLTLFGLGAGAAVLVALQLGGLLRATITPAIPLGLDLAVDYRVLSMTAAITLLTALATGLRPAWSATADAQVGALGRERAPTGRGRRVRQVLVAAQVAVSVVLLIVAGLFLRALQAGRAIDPGFDASGLQLASVTLDAQQREPEEAREFFAGLRRAVEALPGVARAGLGSTTPVGVANTPVPVTVPGRLPPEGQDAFFVDAHIVDPGYLRATTIPLLAGRGIEVDDRAETADVALVNETLARRLFPGASPIGEMLQMRGRELSIVGLVGDTLHLVQNRDPGPLVYLPFEQHPRFAMTLVVRSDLASAALTRGIESEAVRLDGEALVRDARPQTELLETFLLAQNVASRVAGGLGSVGLVLALTGVYGMVAFVVASRSREVGIRMALGATPHGAMRMVLVSAVSLVASGALVGLLAGAALAPLLETFLLGVSVFDPVTLGVTLLAMLGAGTLAAYVPARRVAGIDPAATLRGE